MHTKAVHLRMDFSHGPPPGFIYNPHGQTHMGPGASEQIFAESGESLLDAYVASLQDFKEFLRGDVNKPKRKMVTKAPNRFVDYRPKAQERIVPALEGNKTISEQVIGKMTTFMRRRFFIINLLQPWRFSFHPCPFFFGCLVVRLVGGGSG